VLRRLHLAAVTAVFALSAAYAPAFAQVTTPVATTSSDATPASTARTAAPAASWTTSLDRQVRAIDTRLGSGEIGVYVQRLDSGASYGFRASEVWYLASGVKVPIAIAVMREIEQGWLTLDTQVALRPDDFVDGAGGTNAHRAGDRLTIAWLLEQMLVYSDNTASDVLIRTVGLGQVNAVALELITPAGAHITTLADVRRLAYGMLHPAASDLQSRDLLSLQRAGTGQARVRRLAQILGVAQSDFLLPDLDSAFAAYYASHANSASLRDYGHMLAALNAGRALEPESTRYLLEVMARVQTGKQRIRAGLPADARFAHKTGTQYRRTCDSGIVTLPARSGAAPAPVVVAACVRGAGLAASERALRELGAAVTASVVSEPVAPIATPR